MAEKLQTTTKDTVKYKEPGKYKVVMYNDDFTPMDFVVMVLEKVFHKSQEQAMDIMLCIHKGTKEVVGEYPYDIAKTRVDICTKMARDKGYPFLVKVEQ